jgi:hypothetical protein
LKLTVAPQFEFEGVKCETKLVLVSRNSAKGRELSSPKKKKSKPNPKIYFFSGETLTVVYSTGNFPGDISFHLVRDVHAAEEGAAYGGGVYAAPRCADEFCPRALC